MAWHAKPTDGYSRDSQEAIDNASEIYAIFHAAGFSDNAIYAMLGCFQAESDLNPWQWESNDIQSMASAQTVEDVGYGLPQFTPPRVYINGGTTYAGYAPNYSDATGSPTDGGAQTLYMVDHIPQDWIYGTQYHYNYYSPEFNALTPPVDITTGWSMPFATFKTNTTDSLEDMTVAFMLDYLRPNAQDAASRFYQSYYGNAQYWYQYFTGNPPQPPGPTPVPGSVSNMPLWMMLRKRW